MFSPMDLRRARAVCAVDSVTMIPDPSRASASREAASPHNRNANQRKIIWRNVVIFDGDLVGAARDREVVSTEVVA